MIQRTTIDTAAIAALEQRELERVRQLSLEERGALLVAACRDAHEIEASRLSMGMPASQPAPWPESTWKFMAEAARRARER